MKPRLLFSFPLLLAASMHGQSRLEGQQPGEPAHLLPTDAAVLEDGRARNDLPCSVKPISPELGFDLGYHAGYEVRLPLKGLSGSGNSLTAIFRVTPRTGSEGPVYFQQKWSVPSIEKDARGSAELRGGFVLGEGQYLVEWLMRDRAERFCTARWQVSVEPRGKDRGVELRLPPGRSESERANPFADEPASKSDGRDTLNVAVLVHIAPQARGGVGMQPAETAAALAIVRSIARDPRIGSYSVVGFNLEQNRVLYRQDHTPVNFRALGEAMEQLSLGAVAVQDLIERDGRAQFLNGLVTGEIQKHRPDALILVGPKIAGDEFDASRSLLGSGEPACPVFYLTYDAHPAAHPWQDIIGNAVRVWRGAEFTITKPRDLSPAWTEVMSRLTARTPATRRLHRACLYICSTMITGVRARMPCTNCGGICTIVPACAGCTSSPSFSSASPMCM